jgi:radical SAM superfamily enzyme YgiQ (UPF0313 family)
VKDRTRKRRETRPRSGVRLSPETGAITKDWGGRLPIALIYPNTYYLGMSNLGIQTIYGLLNGYPDVVCERVFWERQTHPLSVESRRPLTDFAVLAFSVSYELDYFNIVPMLRASGLPIYAADRDERHPLIIAGGPCITANPAPLSPFFDCLCLGEAEPILPAMLPVLAEGIRGRRDELLKVLSRLPGIYVPACPPETTIARQWAKNLDDFATTSVIFTPDTELGDLYLIEVERGCRRGCRFCLVSTHFAPMRCRSLDALIEPARQGLRCRKRIGLMGPAVSDYPRIKELLAALNRMGAELSLSSLRINALSPDILDELVKGKVNTITLAPEAGSQRLRRLIGKGISDSDILEALDRIAKRGIRQLKLYFMLGLPSETDDDTEDIIKLTLAAKEILDRHRRPTRTTINLAPFVPKAGTPFQWLPMAPLPTLNRRLSRLKKSLPPKGILVRAESPAWSQIQGVLSRGDDRIAGALANMKEVSLAGWKKASAECQLDIDYYINQTWDTEQKLPWGMIDSGVKIEHLCAELQKALTR